MDTEVNNIKFKNTIRCTKDDVKTAYKLIFKNLILFFRISMFFIMVVDATRYIYPLAMKYGLTDAMRIHFSNKAVIIIYIVAAIIGWQFPRMIFIIYRKIIILYKNSTIELYFYETYYTSYQTTSTMDFTNKINYLEIENIYEMDDKFIFKLKKSFSGTVIPKKSFVIGDSKEFREFLKTSMPNIPIKKA